MSNSTANLARTVAVILGLSALACSGDWCKETTSTVVGETVSGSKQMAKGIAEGVEQGRKDGESIDGAVIVTTMDELNGAGGVQVYAIVPSGEQAVIEVAFENKKDRPMRVSGLDFMVLDSEGFAKKPTVPNSAVTIPANAKNKVSFFVKIPADKVGTIRLWEEELPIPAGALKQAEEADAGTD